MRSYIEITGHRARKKHCFNVINWFLEKYLPRHKLDIMVHHRGLLREGVYGWCTVQDCDYRPRAFQVFMVGVQFKTVTIDQGHSS